jgi:predicted nucleotidyltransferase component of viral defense system
LVGKTSSSWAKLFIRTMEILKSAGIGKDEWTFGGGTALMLYFNHRNSFDIDIFLHDVNLIGCLTPRLNSKTAKYISDYTEASNFLKLNYPEGEIDFILAPFLTSTPWKTLKVQGLQVRVETPVEIIIKKLFYRAELLKARDIFDTVIVFCNERDQLLNESKILFSKYEILRRRWEKIKLIFENDLANLDLIVETDPQSISRNFESYLNELSSLKENQSP